MITSCNTFAIADQSKLPHPRLEAVVISFIIKSRNGVGLSLFSAILIVACDLKIKQKEKKREKAYNEFI